MLSPSSVTSSGRPVPGGGETDTGNATGGSLEVQVQWESKHPPFWVVQVIETKERRMDARGAEQ